MKTLKNKNSFRIKSKKGFTMVELMLSLVFIVIIFGAASYAWYASNTSFQNINATSAAYTQARSLETMLQDAASTSPSLVCSENDTQIDGRNYCQFNFGSTPVSSSFYGDHDMSGRVIMEYDAIDKVQCSIKIYEQRCELKYRIESTDKDGPFYIEGGIILNNISSDSFFRDNADLTYDYATNLYSLTSILNFEVADD